MKDVQNLDQRRWSELVPPHTALSFAAVWDPVEGMIVFSGAHLLDAESGDKVSALPRVEDSPRDVNDCQSQALTIDLLTQAGSGTTPTITLTRDHENTWQCEAQTDTETMMGSQFLPPWLGLPPGMGTGLNSPACASSAALTGLAHDAESFHEPMMDPPGWSSGIAFKRMPVRFDDTPWSSSGDSVTDEGFFEGRQLPTGSYASLPVFVNLNLVSGSVFSPIDRTS